MEKLMIIIVLAILSFVLIAAIKGIDVWKASKELVDKTQFKLPDIKLKHGKDRPVRTAVASDLELYQLKADGSEFWKYDIMKHKLYDEDDDMVGISISHPGADTDGIILHGKKRKDGTYDENDSSTHAALTVNTDAVRIGCDDKGFYGEVTNKKARVYAGTNEKDLKEIKYGETFDINDGTYLLIGHQWLYFSKPEMLGFPGAKKVNTKDKPQGTIVVPTFKDVANKGMKPRQAKNKQDDSLGMSIRFSMDDYHK